MQAFRWKEIGRFGTCRAPGVRGFELVCDSESSLQFKHAPADKRARTRIHFYKSS